MTENRSWGTEQIQNRSRHIDGCRCSGIAEFAFELKDLYETLSGKARLEEPYYVHNDIAFVAETGGHVKVAGRLSKNNAFGFTHDISACMGNPR